MLSFYPEEYLKIPTVKLVIIIDGKEAGHFLGIPHSEWMYEVHMSSLDKKYRGKATLISTAAFEFFFRNNTKVQKIIATIPVHNRLAIRLAKLSGMKLEGTITKSFLLDGVLEDQELYGISRGE